MSATYPAFCSLKQPDMEFLSMPVSVDQSPIFDDIAWHESLIITLRLFEELVGGTVPHYSNMTSSPAGGLPSVTRQTISPGESSTPTRETKCPASGESSTPARETVFPEESYSPTRDMTGPVRSKRAHPRVAHACDECHNKKKKCSGEQPLCLSCQKTGRVCIWSRIKTTKTRSYLKYGVTKLYRPPSRTCERDSMARLMQPYIAAPKPTYPIRLQDMQRTDTLASAVRNVQAASLPSESWVEFPAQIATNRTRTVELDWSELGSSDFSQAWIPPLHTRPPSFGNNLSRAQSLHTRQQLRHEDIYRRALAGY
ncbi:hypothetical protein DEU56DRAFT_825472 [Suillus clintonianus]|uniref:uncharacterized protein n=1 Tax=Suillus clintonianus TaxID=1904413 RepID=UPI001B878E74|nr:uncharacterized protein DEU56DRAFT_825472 [Suillus clintonianus]KAG2125405.1 hypothetical protein DEU56DRAFT_825472 [Suillus clintonianus]